MVNDASGDGTEDKNTRKRNTRNKNAKNKNTGHEITIDNVGGRWVNWLQKEDMLPAIVPNARIMRFGYKSKWMGDESEGPTRTSVRTISPRLLDALKRKRKDCASRPLIIIAHSYGGLVVLKAICDAYDDRKQWEGIFESIRGLIFFSTPFRGADGMSQADMIRAAQEVCQRAEDIEAEPLHILTPDNELLQTLVDDFQKRVWGHMTQTQMRCLYELQKSNVGGIVKNGSERMAFAVNERSGCLDLSSQVSKRGLERNHFNMNKFAHPEEEDYLVVADAVREMAERALQPPTAEAIPSPPMTTTYDQAQRRRVSYFQGRKKQLEQIRDFFAKAPRDEKRVLILEAMGGQGKTQVALKYCKESRSIYSNIFWVNASSREMAVQSMQRVAQEIGLQIPTDDKSLKNISIVVEALARRKKPWLMVLDNYDDPTGFREIEEFMPHGKLHSFLQFADGLMPVFQDGQGDILVTSRYKGLFELGTIIDIPPMPDDDSVALLLRKSFPRRAGPHEENTRNVACNIVQRLGKLPLAIDHAAAYISYRQIPPEHLSRFLKLYDDRQEEVLQSVPEHFWKYRMTQIEGREEKGREISAFTTWEMSFQLLDNDEGPREDNDEQPREDIEHFLTVSAFLQPNHIGELLFRHYLEQENIPPKWMKIFATFDTDHSKPTSDSDATRVPVQAKASWQQDRFWKIIKKAHSLSLVDSIGESALGEMYLSLHPVICDWLQLRASRESAGKYVLEAANIVAKSMRLFGPVINDTLQARVTLLSHADRCLENDRRFSLEDEKLGQTLESGPVARLFFAFYTQCGRYVLAGELYRNLTIAIKTSLGVDHQLTLATMSNLGRIMSEGGKYKEANIIHREVLSTREELLGKEHPYTLATMYDLAVSLHRMGKYEEAEELFKEVLSSQKEFLGEKHEDTLKTMHGLANLLSRRGKYVEAKELFKEVLSSQKGFLGEKHINTLITIYSLTNLLSCQGKYIEAEELFKKVLSLQKEFLGEKDEDTLTTMYGLANLLCRQGKYIEAEKLLKEVLSSQKELLGETDEGILITMHGLAFLLSRQGKYVEAEKLFKEVLSSQKEFLGEKHIYTLTTMYSLANLLSRQGKFVEAEKLEREALSLSQEVLGGEHPATIMITAGLALILAGSLRFREATVLHERAVSVAERVLGPDHPDTSSIRKNYATLRQEIARQTSASGRKEVDKSSEKDTNQKKKENDARSENNERNEKDNDGRTPEEA
ncbi:hypothetical protein RBB50_007323 [Rhinocladiella similis]